MSSLCHKCGTQIDEDTLTLCPRCRESEQAGKIVDEIKDLLVGCRIPITSKLRIERLLGQLKARLKSSDEARIQLLAWQSVFGTTQLSHAQARLEVAEGRVAQNKAQNKEVVSDCAIQRT